MAEYIERERIKGMLKNHYFPTDQEYECDRQWAVGFNSGLDKALHKIHYAPAADVVPVVHGRWENNADDYPECNRCGYMPQYDPAIDDIAYSNYCPNCGARMDGE